MLHITIAIVDKIEALLWVKARSAQWFDPVKSPTDLTANISMAVFAIIGMKRIFPWIA